MHVYTAHKIQNRGKWNIQNRIDGKKYGLVQVARRKKKKKILKMQRIIKINNMKSHGNGCVENDP